MTTLRVGIASYEEMKARTLAVARGERRIAADEPKVWFTSTRVLRQGAVGRQPRTAADHRRESNERVIEHRDRGLNMVRGLARLPPASR